jgi:hypothetical protein
MLRAKAVRTTHQLTARRGSITFSDKLRPQRPVGIRFFDRAAARSFPQVLQGFIKR